MDKKYIQGVLNDIFEGRSNSLGARMYKIRASQEGKGKRGGFRNIFFWKKGQLIIFCLLFSKNEKDNFSSKEKKALKILSKDYYGYTARDIDEKIKNKDLEEVSYD